MPRNYKLEYANYQGTPQQIKRRSMRNQARRKLLKLGKILKNSKVDVDHINSNPLDNSTANLRPLGVSDNRSFPRTHNAHEKRK